MYDCCCIAIVAIAILLSSYKPFYLNSVAVVYDSIPEHQLVIVLFLAIKKLTNMGDCLLLIFMYSHAYHLLIEMDYCSLHCQMNYTSKKKTIIHNIMMSKFHGVADDGSSISLNITRHINS